MDSNTDISIPWSGWQIVRELGEGAFGRVYEIEREIAGTKEKAALKIISRPTKAELERDYNNGYTEQTVSKKYTDLLGKCVGEYKMLMEMKGQTNIVSCDDIAVEQHKDGIGWDIYIRMELLTPLNKRIRNEMLPETEVIKTGKDICKALMLCEERNIVHRDIKPDNIMISRFGDYELGDFGQAKIMDHTTMGTTTGTPGFWAPEVMNFQKYGKEADIYSLGMVLYILLNNKKMPFIDADQVPLMDDVMNAISRRYHGAKIPEPKYGSPALKKVVLKACEFKSEDRYHSAEMMYKALETVERGSYGESRTSSENGTYNESGSYRQDTADSQSINNDWNTSGSQGANSSWGISGNQNSFGTNGWQDTKGTVGNAGTWKSAGSYSAGVKGQGNANPYNQKTVGAEDSSAQKSTEKETGKNVEKTVAQTPGEEKTGKRITLFGVLWSIIAVAAIVGNIFYVGMDEAFLVLSIIGIAGEIVFVICGCSKFNLGPFVFVLFIWKYVTDVLAGNMLISLVCVHYGYVGERIPENVGIIMILASFIWPVFVIKMSSDWAKWRMPKK